MEYKLDKYFTQSGYSIDSPPTTPTDDQGSLSFPFPSLFFHTLGIMHVLSMGEGYQLYIRMFYICALYVLYLCLCFIFSIMFAYLHYLFHSFCSYIYNSSHPYQSFQFLMLNWQKLKFHVVYVISLCFYLFLLFLKSN